MCFLHRVCIPNSRNTQSTNNSKFPSATPSLQPNGDPRSYTIITLNSITTFYLFVMRAYLSPPSPFFHNALSIRTFQYPINHTHKHPTPSLHHQLNHRNPKLIAANTQSLLLLTLTSSYHTPPLFPILSHRIIPRLARLTSQALRFREGCRVDFHTIPRIGRAYIRC